MRFINGASQISTGFPTPDGAHFIAKKNILGSIHLEKRWPTTGTGPGEHARVMRFPAHTGLSAALGFETEDRLTIADFVIGIDDALHHLQQAADKARWGDSEMGQVRMLFDRALQANMRFQRMQEQQQDGRMYL